MPIALCKDTFGQATLLQQPPGQWWSIAPAIGARRRVPLPYRAPSQSALPTQSRYPRDMPSRRPSWCRLSIPSSESRAGVHRCVEVKVRHRSRPRNSHRGPKGDQPLERKRGLCSLHVHSRNPRGSLRAPEVCRTCKYRPCCRTGLPDMGTRRSTPPPQAARHRSCNIMPGCLPGRWCCQRSSCPLPRCRQIGCSCRQWSARHRQKRGSLLRRQTCRRCRPWFAQFRRCRLLHLDSGWSSQNRAALRRH